MGSGCTDEMSHTEHRGAGMGSGCTDEQQDDLKGEDDDDGK